MENNRTKVKPTETKADKFWNIFLFTKNGKIKSTLIVNSFSLSILFLAIYALSFLMLIDYFESLLAGKLSPGLVSFVESFVPALVGSILCCSFFYLFKDKRLVPAAYIWLFLFSLFVFVYLLIAIAPQDIGVFLSLYGMIVPAPVIIGGGFSTYAYIKRKKEEPPVQELPSWKRK